MVPVDYRHSSSSVLNSPNNKKSVGGKFQPLFVTGGCKIMGQWFSQTTRLVDIPTSH